MVEPIRPKFKYPTVYKRTIVDELQRPLFGERAGNTYDNVNDENQQIMVARLEQQIRHQETQIGQLSEQIDNQNTQIARQDTMITNQEEMITNQQTVIQSLVEMLGNQGILITNQEEQTINQEIQIDNQSSMIEHQLTALTNQDTIISRLENNFNVIMNGNTMMIYGNSTDEKPLTDIKIGTRFIEMDTKNEYMFTGNTWIIWIENTPIESGETN